MNKLVIPAAYKADANGGTFSGIANYANVIDSYGDKVMPGAFSGTLAQKGNRFPLLWSHDVTQPLGEVELFESKRGLEVRQGRFVLSVARAAEIYALLKEAPSAIGGMSIGYSTVRDRMNKGIRELHELDLFEISLCVIPANSASVVEAVKGSDGDLARLAATVSNLKRSLNAENDDDRLLGETCERIMREMRAIRFSKQRFY